MYCPASGLCCYQEHHNQEFQNYRATRAATGKRKASVSNIGCVVQAKIKRQSTIETAVEKSSRSVKISQSEFEDQLLCMLVEDMQPLNTVERSGFKSFCSQVLPQYDLPSRRTASRHLHTMYDTQKCKLIAALQSVKWISATADIWSAHKRAYLGVTIHYVNPNTLQMTSLALACRRVRGAHTGDAIGRKLAASFKEFQIQSKVVNVVTDNASNMCKAFTLFKHAANERTQSQSEVPEVEAVRTSATDGSDGEMAEDASLDGIHAADDVSECLDSFNGESDLATEEDVVLPPHKRCGDHSLNLVASVDALKARQDRVYQRQYDRTMAKVQVLWNSVSRSPKLNDVAEEIAHCTFVQPNSTRWCSEFYAVERITVIGLDKVVQCQTDMGLPGIMTEADMKFLTSFQGVMKHVVKAMKCLEGETNCYLGHLIPTVMGLQNKLKRVSDQAMKPLVHALLAGLEARFQPLLSDEEYVLSSILHPKFKLSFIPADRRPHNKQLLLDYIVKVKAEVSMLSDNANNEQCQSVQAASATASSSSLTDSENDDLYSFLDADNSQSSLQEDALSKEVLTVNIKERQFYTYKGLKV
jgi:hypothetical protein